MSYVLANGRSRFTFDDDGTTGLKLSSFSRDVVGAHLWTNAQTALWIARAYDVTSAPSTATADFNPTNATRGAVAVTIDAIGQQIVVTWTAVPIGVDRLNVTLTIRLNFAEDWLRVRVAAAWNGTPTKYGLNALAVLPLKVDPFNNPNDQAFCPSVCGVTSDDPITNLRFSNGVPGFPNTSFGGGSSANEAHYPSGRGWSMAFWGYSESVAREAWMAYVEDWSLETAKVRFESDGTRLVWEWFQLQEDDVVVGNTGRTLGAGYTFCLRPTKLTQSRGWWDFARHYRSRLECIPPSWLPKVRSKRADLSTAEKLPAPFICIQAIDSAHSVGDGRPGDIAGLLATIRSRVGLLAGTPIVGNLDCPTHNLQDVGEDPTSDLRAKVKALYDAGSTFYSFWVPGIPGPAWYDKRQWNRSLGDKAELRWWTTNDCQGAVWQSRTGRLVGGGGAADYLDERIGSYARERTYQVASWNAGARTITVTGGTPNADGFTGTLTVLLVRPSGSSRLADATIQSLGATTIVLSASTPIPKDALGASITPQALDQVIVFNSGPNHSCAHAQINAAGYFARLINNTTLGTEDSWRGCGMYYDTESESILNGVQQRHTTCYRDHSSWSKIDAGYVRHPYGGGAWHKTAKNQFFALVKQAARDAQAAAGRDPFFIATGEDLDECSLAVMDFQWHPVSAGLLFRNTTGFDPTIHKYRTVPATSVVHGGRVMSRALNEEFSSAIGIPSAPFNDATLRAFSAWCLASEWPYGITYPTLSLFAADGIQFVDLWNDAIYVAGGGSVHNDVKKIRDLWAQITFAETRWILKWLRYGEMMPLADLDLSGTDVTTGMAQTPTWSVYYQTYDTVYSRAAFPRVVHAPWKADDGSVCVPLANWSDTAGSWKVNVDLALWGIPKNSHVRIREVDHQGTTLSSANVMASGAVTLSSTVPAFTMRAIVIDRVVKKSKGVPMPMQSASLAGGSAGLLLGEDIPLIVAEQLGPILLPATLTKVDHGAQPADQPTAAPPQLRRAYSCRGAVLDYSQYEFANDLAQVGDRKVLLLAATIQGGAVPAPNDEVTIEGATYRIVADGVRRDPAGATYECRARK